MLFRKNGYNEEIEEMDRHIKRIYKDISILCQRHKSLIEFISNELDIEIGKKYDNIILDKIKLGILNHLNIEDTFLGYCKIKRCKCGAINNKYNNNVEVKELNYNE